MNVYEDIGEFYAGYRGTKRIIGRSAEGRAIYAMLIGTGDCLGISQSAIHAREWITAYLALGHIRRGVRRGSVWVIPLVNPDGAVLSQEKREYALWKANAQGVDLNVNFPARWGKGKSNVFLPASENFVGSSPLCAPESRALAAFTLEIRPRFTVSWHTKGNEIYWKFHQPPLRLLRDRRLALILSGSTGCPLAEAKGSAGGYKDWCIEKLRIPAFTVEVGSNGLSHPLGFGALPALTQQFTDALSDLTEGI